MNYLFNQIKFLSISDNSSLRPWNWLQIWPPDCATYISSKFGHHMVPLTLVTNLATRWRHLHWLRIWPPDGTTCIDFKVGHQVMLHALPRCLGLPYWHYQLVLDWYLHQPESHKLSLTNLLYSVREIRIIPQVPGSDKDKERS